MAKVRINGDTSGYIEISAPNVAGSTTITLPATSGEVAVKATDGSVDLGGVDIDSSGRLLVGTSSALTDTYSTTSAVQIAGVNGSAASEALTRYQDNNAPNQIALQKSRGATVGTHAIVQSGDFIGRYVFAGSDGVGFIPAADIRCYVDGTPGVDDMPGALVFATNSGSASPAERLRLGSDGKFTHFTSSDFQVSNSGTSAISNAFVVRNGATATGTGTAVCQIREDGDIENTNNSYGAISDAKLKENVLDANSQWDDLKSLQVRKYNFKPETGYGTHTQIGLIAQEVELVSPGLVEAVPDRDEDGNDLGTVTKSVNYSVLYMKAVKALQEAMERIETLEASNTDLLARVSALESA